LRLDIVDRCLDQLNAECGQALHELGLGGWSIKFEVEQENKSGGIKRGFQCLITTREIDRPVPIEVWSGGEGQRLKLAVTMGLSSMLCARAGLETNVAFFDESSRHLSEEGIASMVSALDAWAKKEGRQVWIADHNIIEGELFAGTITLVKDEKGTHIQEG
jgi:DNA repair exonuclease SbcCD ATPase subunit